MFLIYDTETTGLPNNYNAPVSDSSNWPRMVQISWQLHDETGKLIEVKNYIIKPEGYEIPYAVIKLHGITTERAEKQGADLDFVLNEFNRVLKQTTFVVGHNIEFDNNIIGAEFYRKNIETELFSRTTLDTKNESTEFCAIPGKGGRFKWPKLEELHQKLFNESFDLAHNAAADVEATARCFLELIRIDIISSKKLGFTDDQLDDFKINNPNTIKAIGLNTQAYNPHDIDEQQADTSQESTKELTPKSHINFIY